MTSRPAAAHRPGSAAGVRGDAGLHRPDTRTPDPHPGMRALHLPSRLSAVRRRACVTQPRMASLMHSRASSPDDPRPTFKRRRVRSPPPIDSAMSAPLPLPLSRQEETVRQLLVDVGADIDRNAPSQEPIVLRFTGGWVRDKLLGIPSHDIDVGINRMTGFDFGSYLAGFLARNLAKYNIPPKTVHRIESNPEKSKHLETATTKILGLDIDLVNLRSETYSGDSRIPEMQFGTPVQDARRRDCTVNALFYNLHSQQVEDFTERGLEDMRKKLIRTPLPPYQTFDDDPLRVLRLLRFSSRLEFEIVQETKEAMQHPDIKAALRLKISRERVGTETAKMLQGQNPASALLQIHSLSLYDCIFAPPLESPPPIKAHYLPLAVAALSHVFASFSEHPHFCSLFPVRYDVYVAWLLAALTPWEGYAFPDANPKKRIPGAATAAREGLRVNNKLFDNIVHAYNNVGLVRAGVAAALGAEWDRGLAGKLVRALGADWRNQVLCAMLLDLVGVWEEGADVPSPDAESVLKQYHSFVGKIYDFGVTEAYDTKTILTGKDISHVFNLKPGPWVKDVLERVLDWQWQNPRLGREEALEWVKASREELVPLGVENRVSKRAWKRDRTGV